MGPVQPQDLPGHLLPSAVEHCQLGLQEKTFHFALVSHYHLQASQVIALAHHRQGNWGLGRVGGEQLKGTQPWLRRQQRAAHRAAAFCKRLVCLGLPPAPSPRRALHQLLKVVNMGAARSKGLGSLAADWEEGTCWNHFLGPWKDARSFCDSPLVPDSWNGKVCLAVDSKKIDCANQKKSNKNG